MNAKYEMDVAMVQHHMEHGKLVEVRAEATQAGWSAFCVTADPAYSATLVTARGAPRVFKTADALITAVRKLEDTMPEDYEHTRILF